MFEGTLDPRARDTTVYQVRTVGITVSYDMIPNMMLLGTVALPSTVGRYLEGRYFKGTTRVPRYLLGTLCLGIPASKLPSTEGTYRIRYLGTFGTWAVAKRVLTRYSLQTYPPSVPGPARPFEIVFLVLFALGYQVRW